MRKSRGATDTQRLKNRRQSRGPEDIRKDLDLRNTARLRASQQSQNISVNHQQPPPNTSTFSSSSSSSSSAAAFNSNEILYNRDEENRYDRYEGNISETSSPVKQRACLVSPMKERPADTAIMRHP